MELLRRRDQRPQPARDDKVLTSWNGLAIAAFADAGRALGEPPFLEMATEAADFLLRELRTPDGRLRRSWKDGRARHAAVLEDHAHLADGLLALYEATFEERWFVAARELADLVAGPLPRRGRRLLRHRRRRRAARGATAEPPGQRAAVRRRHGRDSCCCAWPR